MIFAFLISLFSLNASAQQSKISLDLKSADLPCKGKLKDGGECSGSIPPFFIWQNDNRINPEYFVTSPHDVTLPNGKIRHASGKTNLCAATAITTALIYQKWFKENPALNLRFLGIDKKEIAAEAGPDGLSSIDPILVLNEVVAQAGFNHSYSALKIQNRGDVYATLASYYNASKLNDAKIEVVSKEDLFFSEKFTTNENIKSLDFISQKKQAASITDIVHGLKHGKQVIIGIEANNKSKPKTTRHELNVWGYSKAQGNIDNTYSLYISDPAINYLIEGGRFFNKDHFETITVHELLDRTELEGFRNPNLNNSDVTVQLTSAYILSAGE